MLLHFVSKLQRKPERARRKAALIGAAVVTCLIAILWFLNVSLIEIPEAASEQTASVGPFRALSDGVGAMLAETRAAVADIADIFSENSPDADSVVSPGESPDSK
ncbi:MAG TPA: hypothetical protein VJJ55_01905 [Candidatus Paceibacterota bacterium]